MMKKTVLFIFIGLLFISNVSAQLRTAPYTGSNAKSQAPQADVLKFGYADNIEDGLGTGSTASLSAAIWMPSAKFGAFAGKSITTINIGLMQTSTNVSVWIRSNLNGSNLAVKVVGTVAAGWNAITLDTPFTIPDGNIYIGYTATAANPIGLSNNKPEANECWVQAPGYPWEDMQQYGTACIQAYIDVSGNPIFDLGIEKLNKSQATINGTSSVSTVLRNISSENTTITSLKYAYEINEQQAIEKTITTNIAPNTLTSVNLPIDPINTAGSYNIKVTILEINGQPDVFTANNSATGSCLVAYQFYPKKVVVEEGTGTWCQYCTRGIVGMEMMKEKYPETFIGIAVHNGSTDAMRVATYDNYMAPKYFYGGFPNCVVNRKPELIGDPYFDIEKFFLSEMAYESLASVELSGWYADEDKRNINLTTITTFGLPENNANYRLSYVLIENGVTGTGSGYTQANAYAGGVMGPMGGYEKKPSYITNQVYNEVARGIYSTTGIVNSIPQSITELEPVTHNFTLTLPTNIQNKDNTELIVMLLDKDGEVVNANKIELKKIFVGVSPEVVSLAPANDATGIALDAEVKVIFNQSIETFGTPNLSNIVISGATGVQASFTDSIITIAHDNFECCTEYTVTIPAGSIVGYNTNIVWTFTTVKPYMEFISVTPDDGAADIAVNADVKITFNQAINTLGTPNLNKIGINQAMGVKASYVDRVLIIAHNDFEPDTEYTVTVPKGTVFGYNTDIVWTFKTGKAAIEILEVTPVNSSIDVSINAKVTVTFNKNPYVNGDEPRWDLITIKDATSGIVVTGMGISGNTFLISHKTFDYDTEYIVNIPKETVSGLKAATTWKFKTAKPTGIDNFHADQVAVYPTITSGKVQITTAGKAQIRLCDLTGRTLEVINNTGGTYELDLSNKATGVYFTVITTDDKTITRKIVKK